MNKQVGGFPPEAFQKLASFEDSNWWFRSRNKIIIWSIKKYGTAFKEFLEIGCGTGYVLNEIDKNFLNTNLHAAEFLSEGLSFAQQRVPRAKFRVMDATKLSDKNVYDAIGSFDVIEHIEDDKLALKNMFHALKQDGFLFLTVPQHKWLWSDIDESSMHVRRYSRAELIAKLKNTGFKITFSTSFISILLPIMWLSRKAVKNKSVNSKNEFNIPRWLNFLFESVMHIEIFLLKLGIRLPFGGSLLVVAHKS